MNRFDSDTEFYEETWGRDRCSDCDDAQKEKDNAEEYFTQLRDILYGKKPFDKETINDAMSELEAFFDIKFSTDYEDLKITGE